MVFGDIFDGPLHQSDFGIVLLQLALTSLDLWLLFSTLTKSATPGNAFRAKLSTGDRLPLSFRDIEDLLAEDEVTVS
jgi:hypothetical protein